MTFVFELRWLALSLPCLLSAGDVEVEIPNTTSGHLRTKMRARPREGQERISLESSTYGRVNEGEGEI